MSDISTKSLINCFSRIIKSLCIPYKFNKIEKLIWINDEPVIQIFEKDQLVEYVAIRSPATFINPYNQHLLDKILNRFANFCDTHYEFGEIPIFWTTATCTKLEPVDWEWALISLVSDFNVIGFLKEELNFLNPVLRTLQQQKVPLEINGFSFQYPYMLNVEIFSNFRAVSTFYYISNDGNPVSGYKAQSNTRFIIPLTYCYPTDINVVEFILDDTNPLEYFRDFAPKYRISTGHYDKQDVLKLASLSYGPSFLSNLDGIVLI